MRDREKERNIRLPESYVQQGGPVRPPRPSRARRAAAWARSRSTVSHTNAGMVLCGALAACRALSAAAAASSRAKCSCRRTK